MESDNVVHFRPLDLSKLESSGGEEHDRPMDTPSRHEVTARLEASEARVEAVAAGLRSSMAELGSEVREGLSLIRVDIEKVRADSHKTSLDITRWIMATLVTIGLGFMGLMLTAVGLYLRYMGAQSG